MLNNYRLQYQAISIFFIFLLCTFAILNFTKAGLRGSYYKLGQGEHLSAPPEFVVAQDDGELYFPKDLDLQYVFARNWKISRLGYPKEFPPYRVEWTGFLRVPESQGPKTAERKPGLWQTIYPSQNFIGTPVAQRVDTSIEIKEGSLPREGHRNKTSVEWLGEIEIKQDGEYEFQISSDDGSWLYLDERLIIDHGGFHEDSPRSGKVLLEAGFHNLRIRYFDDGGRYIFRFMWRDPGSTEFVSVPTEFLSHFENQAYSLLVQTNRQFSIELAGKNLMAGNNFSDTLYFSPPLLPGLHPLQVTLTSFYNDGNFQVKWRQPNGRYVVIPREAYRTPAAWKGVVATTVLLVMAIVVLAAVICLYRPNFCTQFIQNYVRFVKAGWVLHALGLIIILGASLRAYQYDVIPQFLDTVDEFMEGWPGWNLVNNGTPRGWVSAAMTKDFVDTRWFSQTLSIADYQFHPPPVFPLFVGLAATIGGAEDMFEISLTHMRIPSLIFSTLTIWMVFLLARRMYSNEVGLLAALVYATLPVAVVSARLVKSENLLTLLSVCATYKVVQYLDERRRSQLIFAGLLCAIAMMTKEIGFFVAITCISLLGTRTKFRDLLFIGLMAIVGLGCYFLYGWWQNWDIFIGTIRAHSAYGSEFDQIVDTFRAARVTGTEVGPGWMIWLWCTVAYAIFARRHEALIPIVVYLFALAVAHIGTGSYGWYWIPLYPYLAICAGLYLRDFLKFADLPRGILMLLTAIVTSIYIFNLYYTDLSPLPIYVRLVIAGLALPFFLGQVFQQKFFIWLRHFTAGFYVLLLVVLNVEIVLHFVRIYSRL